MTLASNPLGTELLDTAGAHPDAVRLSLGNIARANRWFGGRAAVRWALAQVRPRLPPGGTCLLVDIGSGAGDLADDAARWLRRRGAAARPICIDPSREAVRLSGLAGLPSVRADGAHLPLATRSADIVVLSQVVHHFSAESAVTLLSEARRVARHAVIVADLRPSWTGRLAFRVGARLLRFDADTRADGITSLRRAYTASTLARLLAQAGLRARIRRRPGWRLVAVATPEEPQCGR